MTDSRAGIGIRARIEAGFESYGRLVVRHRFAVVALCLALAASLALQLPGISIDTSTEGFLHGDDPIRVAYNEFRDQFGRDEIILIAIRPPDVFDLDFLRKLRSFHDDLERSVPRIEEITSLLNARSTRGEGDRLIVGDLVERLPETPAQLAELRARVLANPLYRNLIVSRDGRFTSVTLRPHVFATATDDESALAGFEEAGAESRPAERRYLTGAETEQIVVAVNAVAARHRAADFELYLAGAPVMTTTLQAAMMRDMGRFTGLALGCIGALLLLIFRRPAAVLLPLAVVILSLTSSVGLMVAVGMPITFTTQILPSFLLAVGVAYAVHVLAIFYQQLRAHGRRDDAIVHALGHSGLAIVMTGLTTAGGLVSFASAPIAPIAMLGTIGPAGVGFCLLYGLVLLPALLAILPLRAKGVGSGELRSGLTERLLVGIGTFTAQRPLPVLSISALLVAVALAGALRVRFSHDPMAWFPPGHPLRVANELTNRAFEGAYPFELIVDSGRENGLQDPALLERLDALARSAEKTDYGPVKVGKAFSIADVTKEIHQALNENRADFYAIPGDPALVAQELFLFENSGSDDLEELADSQLRKARLTLRVSWGDALHFPAFLDSVQAQAAQLIGEGARVHVTGLVAVMSRTFSGLVYSMALSYLTGFLIITPLMIVLIGSLRGGLVAMVPNLVPLLIVLGFMGFAGIPIDVFTLLVGSIALGLVVDDTIHVIHNFRRDLLATGDALGALRSTLETTGRAVTFSSVALGLGFWVFTFSELDNLWNFGALSALAIGVAALVEFAMTPPLLMLVSRRMLRSRRLAVGEALQGSTAVGLAALLLLAPATAGSAELEAREIMQRVEDRDDGDHATMEMEMVLVDKNGQTRERKMRSFARDQGPDRQQLMFFEAPADVKDTGFLTFDYDDPARDDDQWLYLPALRKTKRIAQSDRSGSFMGSDLNYADMTERDTELYDYTLMKETEVGAHKVWQIQSIPKTKDEIDRTGYEKSIVFVRQDNYVVVRAVNWVKGGAALKYLDMKGIEQIDGVWVVTEMHVMTKKGDEVVHRTVLHNRNVRFNQPMTPELFSVRQLEKGL